MRNYQTFNEWEKDEALNTMKGFVYATIISTFFWVVLLVFGCARAQASVEMDMTKIAMIESSGNPGAWNKKDDSIGLFQITPIVLKEWNNFHPKEQFTRSDLWNPAINHVIADWYMNKRIPQMFKHYGIEDSVRNRIVAYNAGISYLVKGKPIPQITKNYLKKYGVSDEL